jgi:hypothetical protein
MKATLVVAADPEPAAGVAVGVSTSLFFWAALTCQGDGWECLFFGLRAMAYAMLLAPVLSWVVLWLLRVERSYAVAACGTLTTLVLLVVVPAPFLPPVLAVPMLLVLCAAGYGGTALALSRLTPPWLTWMYVVGLALFLVVAVLGVLTVLQVL